MTQYRHSFVSRCICSLAEHFTPHPHQPSSWYARKSDGVWRKDPHQRDRIPESRESRLTSAYRTRVLTTPFNAYVGPGPKPTLPPTTHGRRRTNERNPLPHHESTAPMLADALADPRTRDLPTTHDQLWRPSGCAWYTKSPARRAINAGVRPQPMPTRPRYKRHR
ncbi:hypothetical protein LZ31DRAFT_560381 [Colletotrichum somersetense]|nr:hypothetical protein LZ31DRAFT_560381 [Colletotrichum somersetense]